MRFLGADGETELVGEVWSPGPAVRSVWVLLPDGTPVAVKLATTCKPARVLTVDGAPYLAEVHGAWELAAQWSRMRARYAPHLPAKEWRAALADT